VIRRAHCLAVHVLRTQLIKLIYIRGAQRLIISTGTVHEV